MERLSSSECPFMTQDSYWNEVPVLKGVPLPQKEIDKHIQPRHGTTTLAFITRDGIIIAVDSKATAGAFVASRTVNKVIEINPYLLGTMAGGAADCFFWEKLLGVEATMYELENEEKISAQHASKILADMMRSHRRYRLSMSSMICGYDLSGPSIYNVTNEGMRVKHHIFSVGSGSTVAKGILTQRYRFDMTKTEALELGKDAIYAAGMRDAATGGVINLYFMDQTGWQKVGSWDLNTVRNEKESKKKHTQ